MMNPGTWGLGPPCRHAAVAYPHEDLWSPSTTTRGSPLTGPPASMHWSSLVSTGEAGVTWGSKLKALGERSERIPFLGLQFWPRPTKAHVQWYGFTTLGLPLATRLIETCWFRFFYGRRWSEITSLDSRVFRLRGQAHCMAMQGSEDKAGLGLGLPGTMARLCLLGMRPLPRTGVQSNHKSLPDFMYCTYCI